MLITLLFPATLYAHRRPNYIAGAVTVMCAETGLFLYGSNQHRRHYPASLVKVMTALIVLENVTDLEDIVYFSETAVTLPWYAANMGLREGDTLTVREALYGIMLPSANEVANALAEYVAGDRASFLVMMNRRAYELGAFDTHFVNACGLPGEGQHTTAYDMSLIMREAITHPVFVEIINTAYFTFPPSRRHPEPRTLRNTNRLVREGDALHNEWVVGGKTGWIIAARNTLTTYSVQDGRGIIVTVLYTDGAAATFEDTVSLLSHGFYLLAEIPLPEAELPVEEEVTAPPEAAIPVYLPASPETEPIEPIIIEETEPADVISPMEQLRAFAWLITQILLIIAAIIVAIVIYFHVCKQKPKGA